MVRFSFWRLSLIRQLSLRAEKAIATFEQTAPAVSLEAVGILWSVRGVWNRCRGLRRLRILGGDLRHGGNQGDAAAFDGL